MTSTDFRDVWGATWEVEKTITRAKKHIIENTTRTFRTGRPVIEVVFFDENRREVARRDGMLLKSKKGNEYAVCRREDPTPNETASHAPTVGEIFADI